MEILSIIILISLIVFPIYKIWDNNRKIIIYIILPKKKYFTLKVKKKTCNHVKYFFNPYNYNKYPEVLKSTEIHLDIFHKNFKKIDYIPEKYKRIIEINNFEIY